jgi:predicted transposase YbfD/YdcC
MEPKPRAVLSHFGNLPDPRVERTQKHRLLDILVVAICAVIGGANSWPAVVTFGQAKLDWFRRFLELPNGIPSHDTFGRVFALLNPQKVQECFQSWLTALCDLPGVKHIAIDGKTLRGSGNGRGAARRALHFVHAWAQEHHVLLAGVATEAKSNEITAIPKLLELLDLHGAFVTIDAMGCQKEIAEQIRDQGGHYVLAVKENQPHLYEDIERFWQGQVDVEWAAATSAAQTHEVAHGREEDRYCWVFPAGPWLRDPQRWRDLKAVVVVVTERAVGASSHSECRYYIVSRQASAKRMLQVIRGHWGVENSLHWVLDVTFDEDASRVHKDHAPENLALLRRLALALLKHAGSDKDSIKTKRLRAGWDNDFLEKVIFESTKT